MHFADPRLAPVWEKILRGERLSLDDGLLLYRTDDLMGIGKMAHFVQQERSGDAVYFVVNQKIEHTNICVLACKFCDFAVKKGDPGAYEMTAGDILATLTPEIREVHITGGMPPDWPWERYVGIVRAIHEKFPQADIKAYTAVEIDFFHKKFRKTVREVLAELKAAGLRTLPGGGAEVFSERVRKLLFNQKIGARAWFEVHKEAHRMGIPTNSTMLYGHVETVEERLIHMIRLREAQDETGGFLTFIPLAFQPGETGIKPRDRFTSAIDDLRTIAVARLMLDNFPHIKAYWVMLTEEVASIALHFGADDMDGTVGQERIAHDAGAVSPMKLAKDQIVRLIRDAGKIPVERDVYYNPLAIHSDDVVGRIPYLNSVPFYHRFEKRRYRILPVTPRRMGMLERDGGVVAGPFSLMDYFRDAERLELLNWCIATRDQVRSVILFTNHGWRDLEGKRIGITDDTATSVRLLRVLLEKKHGVRAHFERLRGGLHDAAGFDAVLLIGDEALRRMKYGLAGFDVAYDLAKEWYEWKKMPFVFAVWAVKKSLPAPVKEELDLLIGASIAASEGRYGAIGALHGTRIALPAGDVEEYLEGFNYRLGERERAAMEEFRRLEAACGDEEPAAAESEAGR